MLPIIGVHLVGLQAGSRALLLEVRVKTSIHFTRQFFNQPLACVSSRSLCWSQFLNVSVALALLIYLRDSLDLSFGLSSLILGRRFALFLKETFSGKLAFIIRAGGGKLLPVGVNDFLLHAKRLLVEVGLGLVEAHAHKHFKPFDLVVDVVAVLLTVAPDDIGVFFHLAAEDSLEFAQIVATIFAQKLSLVEAVSVD